MSHCLVQILVQMHNWAIFLRKWAKSVDHYRVMLKEFSFIKIEEEVIGNIWFQQDGATLDVLRPAVEDRIISRRADDTVGLLCVWYRKR